jgi:hypothetical protein
MKKITKIVSASLASLLVLSSGIASIFAFATEKSSDSSVASSKYEKPSMEDVYAQEEGINSEPDDISSNDSELNADKEWVEYVEYDTDQAVGETVVSSRQRYRAYMPTDVEEACVMNISDGVFSDTTGSSVGLDTNKFDVNGSSKQFTTADSITVQYSYQYSYTIKASVSVKFSIKIFDFQLSSDSSWSHSQTQTYSQTFQAKYYNSNGTAYSWRVVSYNLEMPILVCQEKLVNNEWIVVKKEYTSVSVAQGLCRQWIEDGNIYYESWSNGNAVLQEDFWANSYNWDNLAYVFKLKYSKLRPNLINVLL